MSLIQFQDLPSTSTPLNANNLNNNFEYLDGKNNYSTTEQVIGKWIDNKPIYRAVINGGSLPNNTVKNISISNLNIDKLITLKGFAYNSNGDSFMLPGTGIADNINNELYNYQNTYATIWSHKDNSAFSCYIILEYTKTD